MWIDCEMTGLDPKTDVLLEIATIVTTYDLEIVARQISGITRERRQQFLPHDAVRDIPVRTKHDRLDGAVEDRRWPVTGSVMIASSESA